jgi:hypothetical protein
MRRYVERTQGKFSPPISCVGGASAFAVSWCRKMDAKNVSVSPKKRGVVGYLRVNKLRLLLNE